MGKAQDFNIGDAVYTVHVDEDCIYLKYQLVVGVDTRMKINFHGAHLSSDLAENITGFIYNTMTIYTNDDGTFSLNSEDCPESVDSDHVFETQDDARSYLFDMIDNIKIREI